MSYRESQAPPRYLCIVCWRTVSPVEGLCCGVPMCDLEGDPAIVEELRARARAKKARPERLRVAWVGASAALLSVALHAALLAAGVYHVSTTRGGWGRRGAAGEVGGLVFVTFLVFLVALYYLTLRLKLFPVEEFDPERADAAALLRWLGM